MKKNLVILSMLMSLMMIGGVLALGPVENAIIDGADRLVETQNDDGGWEWNNPNIDPNDGTSSTNTFGVTAQGLLDAYELTGNSVYLDAAKLSGDWLITRFDTSQLIIENRINAFDIVFLYDLGEISDVKYTNKANDLLLGTLEEDNFWAHNFGDFCSTETGCTAQNMFDAINNCRKGESGIILWDLAPWVTVANLGGQTSWADDLKILMDVEYATNLNSGSDYYNIGLSGVVSATGNTNAVEDLIYEQSEEGSWIDPNGAVQNTAYAVMALLKVNEKDAVLDAINYLMDSQLVEGGWDDPENTEVTSEAVQAISDFGDVDGPIIGNPIIIPEYINCDYKGMDNPVTVRFELSDPSGIIYSKLHWTYSSDPSQEYWRTPAELSEGTWQTQIWIPEVDVYDEVLVKYKIFATDNVGNEKTKGYNNLFTYDCSVPTTSDNAPDIWTNQDVIVTLTCTDLISDCQVTYYSTNGSEPTLLYENPFTLTATGEYQLRYYSIDNAGNQENVKDGTLVKIDKEVPTITDDYLLDGIWTNLDQAIILTPEDTGNSGINEVKYCEGISCTPNIVLPSPYGLSYLTSQDIIVRYQAWDIAEGFSAIGEFNVKMDKITPETSDDVPLDWKNSIFNVLLSVVDSGLSPITTYYRIWLSGETEPSTWTEGNTISVNTDGEYNIKYYSEDEAGNNETEKSSANTAKLDTVEPSLIVESISDTYAEDFTLQITESDETSGLNTCEYKVTSNGVVTQDWIARTCGIIERTITVGPGEECNTEGTDICEVEIRVSDNAGNIAETSKIFSIDWTNPPQVLNSGPDGTIWNSFATLNVETNKPATCRYDTVYKSSYDAMSYVIENTGGLQHTHTLTNLIDKQYSYYVLCADNAENQNEMTQSVSILFDVDTRENFVVTIPETKGNYLIEGWNQFFLPSFVLDDTDLESPYEVEEVLQSIEGSYDMLYHFDGNAWKTYNPERVTANEEPLNDLEVFNGGGFPYFIDMNVSGERIEIQ